MQKTSPNKDLDSLFQRQVDAAEQQVVTGKKLMDTGRCSETGGKRDACFSRCKLKRSRYWCRSPPRKSTEPGRDSLLSVRYVCFKLSCENKTPLCMHHASEQHVYLPAQPGSA